MVFPRSSLGDYYSLRQPHARVSHLRLVLKPTLWTPLFFTCLALCPLPSLNPLPLPPHRTSDESHTGVKLLESTRGWAGPRESFNGSSYPAVIRINEEILEIKLF